MRVLLIHNSVSDNTTPDDQDTLWQAAAVSDAIQRLGHDVSTFAVTLNLEQLRHEIALVQPDVIFNLVECLAGTDRLIAVVPLLLDALNCRYTGATAQALTLTSNKVLGKERLAAAEIPTAQWWGPNQPSSNRWNGHAKLNRIKAIIKPVAEHASVGMGDDCIVEVDSDMQMFALLNERTHRYRSPLFAERFIDGREINVSILASSNGPIVLPPAEIDFTNYPDGKPRIVGYNAKWVEHSFEYQNTPRTFEFSESDRGMLNRVREIAADCWRLFDLRGYARVDFRIDSDGNPWVLEINANPCLTPEGGFWAALERANISYDSAIQNILMDVI